MLLPLVTCHLSLVTFHLSSVTCHLLLVTCHLSLVTFHLSPVTCHLSLATFHLSSASCHASLVNCHLSYNKWFDINTQSVLISYFSLTLQDYNTDIVTEYVFSLIFFLADVPTTASPNNNVSN